MSTGQESPSDRQDASRFAPKWARDPDQNRTARPPRPDGAIWLGDAEEAAKDGFQRGEEDKGNLFPPPLDPTVMPNTWSAPPARRPAWVFLGFGAIGLAAAVLAVGVVRGVDTTGGDSTTPPARSRPAPAASANESRTRVPTGRLVVSTPTSAFLPDEVAPLGLAIYGTGQRGDVVIGGYAPGSQFSTGQATGEGTWLLSAAQIDGAAIAPPPGFAGAMEMIFELRLADGRVADRKRARLEWSAPPPAPSPSLQSGPPVAAPAVASSMPSTADAASGPRTLSAAELAALLKRGNELVARGDLVGARLFFERAAQAGESRAALALASTYDPVVLEQLGERGLAPDIAMARFWYEKAKGLGSKEAPERLEVLASRSN